MRRQRRPSGRIVICYDYRDETGRLLYRVRRHDPKGFSVVAASGSSLLPHQRFRRVPSRLRELLVADFSQTVFVVEGEKDVETLMAKGLLATCNAFGGGIGKWTRGHSRYLSGRPVVILPDNDQTGAEHAHAVATALAPVAASIKLILLPGLPHKGDVSNWLDDGHTVEDLQSLVEAAPPWRPGRQKLPEPSWSQNWERDYDSLRNARQQRRSIYGLPLSPAAKLVLLLISEYRVPKQNELAA